MAEFIECTSLSISYNIFGIATVTYTIVSDTPGLKAYDTIRAGGRTFTGYVTNISMNPIPGSNGWYENHVTIVATS